MSKVIKAEFGKFNPNSRKMFKNFKDHGDKVISMKSFDYYDLDDYYYDLDECNEPKTSTWTEEECDELANSIIDLFLKY